MFTIDSEIRSHILDWAPNRLCADCLSGEITESEASSSHVKDDSSSTNESITPSYALERLPSGREYWSDLPKAIGGNSPRLPNGITRLSSVCSLDDPNSACSLESLKDETAGNRSREEKEAQVRDNCKMLTDAELHVKIDAQNLQNLLEEQQKEIKDLKMKHELAILDFVHEVPEEIHQQVLKLCSIEMSDYKIA